MTDADPVVAWHFLQADCRLRYAPASPVVRPGITLTVAGRPILCRHGFHASLRALDALSYAPGPVACRVELGGDIEYGSDKLVAQGRTVVAMYDASEDLRRFARECALEVLPIWRRHVSVPQVVEDYLRTGDPKLSDRAYAAADAAAGSTYAAYATAYAAHATSYAAYAARAAYAANAADAAADAAAAADAYAAYAADAYAARAARAAARERQNDRLTAILLEGIQRHAA